MHIIKYIIQWLFPLQFEKRYSKELDPPQDVILLEKKQWYTEENSIKKGQAEWKVIAYNGQFGPIEKDSTIRFAILFYLSLSSNRSNLSVLITLKCCWLETCTISTMFNFNILRREESEIYF